MPTKGCVYCNAGYEECQHVTADCPYEKFWEWRNSLSYMKGKWTRDKARLTTHKIPHQCCETYDCKKVYDKPKIFRRRDGGTPQQLNETRERVILYNAQAAVEKERRFQNESKRHDGEWGGACDFFNRIPEEDTCEKSGSRWGCRVCMIGQLCVKYNSLNSECKYEELILSIMKLTQEQLAWLVAMPMTRDYYMGESTSDLLYGIR